MYKNNIKLLVAMIIAAFAAQTYANDVYINQIGDNTAVTITQTGAGNLINGDVANSSSTDPAVIKGANNTVNINQLGAGNTLSLILNNETNGMGATVDITADGSGNIQSISCGSVLASNCNAGIIRSDIVGDNNIATQTLNGGVATSRINIVGSYNTISHTASGTGAHVGDIVVSGSGTSSTPSVVNLAQSGALTKNAYINSNGSNNNISVVQSD